MILAFDFLVVIHCKFVKMLSRKRKKTENKKTVPEIAFFK